MDIRIYTVCDAHYILYMFMYIYIRLCLISIFYICHMYIDKVQTFSAFKDIRNEFSGKGNGLLFNLMYQIQPEHPNNVYTPNFNEYEIVSNKFYYPDHVQLEPGLDTFDQPANPCNYHAILVIQVILFCFYQAKHDLSNDLSAYANVIGAFLNV